MERAEKLEFYLLNQATFLEIKILILQVLLIFSIFGTYFVIKYDSPKVHF